MMRGQYLAQLHAPLFERPGHQLATAIFSAELLELITAIKSFHDLTNDFAPSS